MKRGQEVKVLVGADKGRIGVVGSVSRKHGLVTVFIDGVDDAYRFDEVTEMNKFVCPTDHKHGVTSTCYTQHKCRCDECRAVNAERARALAARRDPDIHRMEEAAELARYGFPTELIAEMFRVPADDIQALLRRHRRRSA